MSAFAYLGLPDDADERAIKRVYAQRLKQTRPEDDPAGFQQLHTAYQTALHLCRQRVLSGIAPIGDTTPSATAAATPDDSADIPVASAAADDSLVRIRVAPAPQPTTMFSMAAFCDEAIALASKGGAEILQQWLGRHPALWSLQLKNHAGRALVQQIYRQEPPMPAACLTTLLQFFDLDHALAGHDPLALQLLRRRTQLAWELQPEQRLELTSRLTRIQDKSISRKLARTLRQLERPFHWLQVLVSGIDVTKPRRIANTVGRLTGGMPDAMPTSIRRDQLAFWLAAADRTKVGKPRLLLGVTRSIAGMLAMLLVGLLSGLAFAVYPDRFIASPLIFLVSCAAAASATWLLLMAWIPLDQWHARSEELPARWPWICLMLIPILCSAGLLLTMSPFPATSLLLIVPATLLAFRRYGRRQGGGRFFSLARRFVWIGAVMLSQIVRALNESDAANGAVAVALLPGLLAGVALVAWCLDLWKNRRRLRVRSGPKRMERRPA
jgi:hypothetical protein